MRLLKEILKEITANRDLPDEEEELLRDSLKILWASTKVPPEGRFGRRKIFIWSVWEESQKMWTTFRKITYEEFKKILVNAHQKDYIILHRADLVGDMDPELVRKSEIAYMNATFNFIEDTTQGLRWPKIDGQPIDQVMKQIGMPV